MGHYASEMGADIPYDYFSKEAIKLARKTTSVSKD